MLYLVNAVLSVYCAWCMLYSVYVVHGICCTRCMLYLVNSVLSVCCTRCMLYSVYAVLGVCCTRCMLYLVYAVLGVCCTRCMLYSVYAVLGVCCPWCQLVIMTWRDREGWLNFVFCNDSRVLDEKKRNGDEDENDMENTSGHEKSGVQQACLGWKDFVLMLLQAGSGLVPAISEMVNLLAHRTLSRPSFLWWFRPFPLISLFLVLNSTIILEHKVKSSVPILWCHNQESTLSTASTEYSILWVQHHLKIDCLLRPSLLSSLGKLCFTEFSTFPQLWVNQSIESQLLLCLPTQQPPQDWPPPSTPPTSHNHGLQVYLSTR